MVMQLNLFSMEVTRVAREVGSEGKLGGQAKVKGVAVYGKTLTIPLTRWEQPDRTGTEYCEVTTAVAKGDLSKKDNSRRKRRNT
jgi:hypothetical protein